MLNRIKFKMINNIKLKNQLYITNLFLIISSILIMSIIYYKTSYNITLDNIKSSSLNLVKNNNNIINIKMNKIIENSDKITVDHDLFKIVNNLSGKTNYDFVVYDRKINDILFKYLNFSDVYSTHIITSSYNFGSAKIPIKQDFYNKSQFYSVAEENNGSLVWIPTYKFTQAYGFYELENIHLEYDYLFSAVKILNNLDNDNIKFNNTKVNNDRPLLIINFSPNIFDDILQKNLQYENSKYFILSQEGDIVYSTNNNNNYGKNYFQWMDYIDNNNGIIEKNIDGKKSLIIYGILESTNWISALIIPVDSILNDFIKVKNLIIVLVIILILISSICVNFISRTVTKPIERLLLAIKEIGKGNFSNKVDINGSYEITNLITKFNEMDQKIADLIEENYLTKIREKEAVIMSLNIQLNPHFLYNTLNTINWLAIGSNEREISKMIVSLSNMLQYTAHNNDECSEFYKDLQWLKEYIYIMQVRFGEKFKVRYLIDNNLNNYKVPKLFLQPFVENSIIHGFSLTDRDGIIEIKGYKEERKICFCVSDNGKGIEEDKIKDILERNAERIGISNVNKRIKLLYGEEYGINICSKLNEGTNIYIFLPVNYL